MSGQPAPEYHHLFCEWADADAVDWTIVKAIALGEITEIPVLDLITDQPTGESLPAQQSPIWIVFRLTALHGFDWQTLDPAKPETFVDSMQNMLPLHPKFHRPLPTFVFQGYPSKAGFVFTTDELKAITSPFGTQEHE